jgi:hypothetical protein
VRQYRRRSGSERHQLTEPARIVGNERRSSKRKLGCRFSGLAQYSFQAQQGLTSAGIATAIGSFADDLAVGAQDSRLKGDKISDAGVRVHTLSPEAVVVQLSCQHKNKVAHCFLVLTEVWKILRTAEYKFFATSG